MIKVCKCGKKHNTIPATAKYFKDDSELSGWYWDCSCNSTLFVKENTDAEETRKS